MTGSSLHGDTDAAERCPECRSDDTRALTWTSQHTSMACESCKHRWQRWRYDTTAACNCRVQWLDGAGNHSPGCRAVRCPGCRADVASVVFHECMLTGQVTVNPDGLPLL